MSNEENKKYLSYSGYSTYVTCPKKYDYHYNEKLRPKSEPFHLIFGSAVDKALNELLLDPTSYDQALNLAKLELLRLFSENISFQEKDIDGDLFTNLTESQLIEKLRSCEWKGDNPSSLCSFLMSEMDMGVILKENQQKALKYLCYFSAVEKVALMLNSFIEYILPQIEKVHSVQRYVKRGILDFEADFKGLGFVSVDNKTASYPYEQDAVFWSVQLAGYGAKKAMYIVFNKNVKKNKTKVCSSCGKDGTGQRHKTCDNIIDSVRCNNEWVETITPEVVPQIVVDDIPQHNRDLVEQAYQDVEKAVELKCFPRNLTNCQKQFGRPCEYIKLCWHNDMSGLVVKEKEGSKS